MCGCLHHDGGVLVRDMILNVCVGVCIMKEYFMRDMILKVCVGVCIMMEEYLCVT